MREYHYHPDKVFIIRENQKVLAILSESEISQFSQLALPQGCTEVLVSYDGIVYATINKSMEGMFSNPLQELINKEKEIIEFYKSKIIEE